MKKNYPKIIAELKEKFDLNEVFSCKEDNKTIIKVVPKSNIPVEIPSEYEGVKIKIVNEVEKIFEDEN
jgi:hypothetical protein